MEKYIDFDQVIVDSEVLLFKEYELLKKYHIYLNKLKYVKRKDWFKILENAEIINDSIRILREMDEGTILTRVHSMENEGKAKIEFLRSNGVKQNIILCPYMFKKRDIVSARGNILVDDAVFNLKEWEEAGGIPIFFDKNGNGIDGWGKKNSEYRTIDSLEKIKKL